MNTMSWIYVVLFILNLIIMLKALLWIWRS